MQDRTGRWNILGFRNFENWTFIGEVVDPIPVVLDGRSLVSAKRGLASAC